MKSIQCSCTVANRSHKPAPVSLGSLPGWFKPPFKHVDLGGPRQCHSNNELARAVAEMPLTFSSPATIYRIIGDSVQNRGIDACLRHRACARASRDSRDGSFALILSGHGFAQPCRRDVSLCRLESHAAAADLFISPCNSRYHHHRVRHSRWDLEQQLRSREKYAAYFEHYILTRCSRVVGSQNVSAYISLRDRIDSTRLFSISKSGVLIDSVTTHE